LTHPLDRMWDGFECFDLKLLKFKLGKITSFHSDDNVECGLLGCDTVLCLLVVASILEGCMAS
jgi:hypothetical protein